jgi:hypothetical protein
MDISLIPESGTYRHETWYEVHRYTRKAACVQIEGLFPTISAAQAHCRKIGVPHRTTKNIQDWMKGKYPFQMDEFCHYANRVKLLVWTDKDGVKHHYVAKAIRIGRKEFRAEPVTSRLRKHKPRSK